MGNAEVLTGGDAEVLGRCAGEGSSGPVAPAGSSFSGGRGAEVTVLAVDGRLRLHVVGNGIR